MIDRALDHIARFTELALALAFMLAVLLNFGNVIGRYFLGRSLLGADEIQIFIMVAMTFLGAAVVTRRNQHLRMDVLVRHMPAGFRLALRLCEHMLLIALAGFVLAQSCFYAFQMLKIGRSSDMADTDVDPAWFVALGFVMILLFAGWRLITTTRRNGERAVPTDAAVRE